MGATTRKEMIKQYNLKEEFEYKGVKVYKGMCGINNEESYAWFTYNDYYKSDMIIRYSTMFTLSWIKHQITKDLKLGNIK